LQLTLLEVVPLFTIREDPMRSRITAVAAPTNKKSLIAQIALVLIASAASACVRTASSASATSETDSSAVAIVAHPVTVSTRAWSTTASGIVHANTTVDVAFEVAGKVANVGPDEGQSVRAGEAIASLDPAAYRFAVEQTSAGAERAARDRDRNRPLLTAGSISPADMDHLETGARESAAAADLAKKRLADTRLIAPMSGVIARRSIEVGAMVAPGQPAYTIVALDPMRVRVGVPESDIGRVTEGAATTVRIPALDTSFTGRVSLIGVAADPATRSYTVEISVPNPARRLRDGMVAEATITTKATTSAIVVPASAVVHDATANSATVVYVLDRDAARAHARRVITGAARGDSLEITSGLDENDRIVVAGQQRLREGAAVKLVSPQSNAVNGSTKP
jgi:RND family efflux transporter MFP subunit